MGVSLELAGKTGVINFMRRLKEFYKSTCCMGWLNELLEVFRTASREANSLVIFATTLLLLKILLFNKIPAAFSGAYEIGLWVDSILASIIASYAFYIVVVHIKERSDKNLLQPYIQRHAGAIVGQCAEQVKAFSKATAVDMNLSNITEDRINDAFKKLHPYGKSELIADISDSIVYATWMSSMAYYMREANTRVAKVISQPLGLDASTVEILTRVEDCEHFVSLKILEGVAFGANDLTNFSGRFYRYCLVCLELKCHLEDCKVDPQ